MLFPWKDLLLEFLFPTRCVICGAFGQALCNACAASIRLAEPACFVCNARKPSGSICASCRPHAPNLARVWWAADYDDKRIRKTVTEFKYNGNRALAEALADSMVASVKKRAQAHNIHISPRAMLLAIPLHPRKLATRGFNQAEFLAAHIAARLSLALLPTRTLSRVKNTPPQAKAGGREHRKKNMDQAFTVPSQHIPAVQNKTIILIDDIATTGSTLNDAARALKEVEAAHVWGLVFAKG